jgi:hypothetical protein
MGAALKMWQDELAAMSAATLTEMGRVNDFWLLSVARGRHTPKVTLITILVAQTTNQPVLDLVLCRRAIGNLYRLMRNKPIAAPLKKVLTKIQLKETDPISLRAISALLHNQATKFDKNRGSV